MPRSSMFADPAPADARTFKSLKWVKRPMNPANPFAGDGKVVVKAWRGKQSKPFANHWFRTDAEADHWLDGLRREEDRREAMKAERKAAATKGAASMMAAMKPGVVLHYSWGYDQTNADFFEVLEVGRATVKVREIKSETRETGFMSGKTKPLPGQFVENAPVLVKKVNAYGVSMEHGTARPVPADSEHYVSWYA